MSNTCSFVKGAIKVKTIVYEFVNETFFVQHRHVLNFTIYNYVCYFSHCCNTSWKCDCMDVGSGYEIVMGIILCRMRPGAPGLMLEGVLLRTRKVAVSRCVWKLKCFLWFKFIYTDSQIVSCSVSHIGLCLGITFILCKHIMTPDDTIFKFLPHFLIITDCFLLSKDNLQL